ncbi:MAG: YggS family pyridoxal phosphate-dependent enzyme [Synergistaceae bacterium]|nr:YggS family pyridoxal phosphate-dependent enzyme [Synergistaceae bacterium]
MVEERALTEVKDRVAVVRERMERSAERAGRGVAEIKLMAVTKTRRVEEMLEAAPFVDMLGENRVQEAAVKKRDWPGSVTLQWRLIGHLQSNKARKALTLFDTLDSLDSEGLASDVNRIAGDLGRDVPVLIEVNTSGEVSKTGVAPEDFPKLLERVLACPRLKLEGLMTIGPLTEDEARVRSAFAHLREMAAGVRAASGLPLPVLSMGMSGDYEWAILEGSTLIRIGTLLFGARH